KYFNKIDCFCFTEQILAPGQEMDMPVSFFVDPTIMNDINMGEIKTITLSYTFLRAESEEEKNAALWKNSYEDPVGWMAALSGGLPAPDKFAPES
ncbi:MAG: cytochrome c oxidase assembly protein, partial [Alphaproteobacteria bacterium]|nr:cytochrome c oxidase assembly protein [Alphaproteobacteria bacterium]